jgi:hypothetical protein
MAEKHCIYLLTTSMINSYVVSLNMYEYIVHRGIFVNYIFLLGKNKNNTTFNLVVAIQSLELRLNCTYIYSEKPLLDPSP